jgi:hypothetical protein
VLLLLLQGVASAALQEAYDDLAVRFNGLELENAKQQMQLVGIMWSPHCLHCFTYPTAGGKLLQWQRQMCTVK